MFIPHEAVQRFTPGPGTVDTAAYGDRLRTCWRCFDRRGDGCPSADNLEAHCRSAGSICLAGKWHAVASPAEASGRPRVGLLSPCWTVGGVERWFLSILKHSTLVDWAGVAVTTDLISREMIEATRRYCPVDVGAAHVPELLARCDTLIVWGNEDARPWLQNWKGWIVVVSHGTGEWTRQRVVQYADIASDLVAVSEAATMPFPPAIRKRARVILNGIEYDRLAPTRPRAVIRQAWEIGDKQLAVGYCGRYSAEKRPASAAHAVGRIPAAVAVYMVPELSRPNALQEVPAIAGDRVRWHTGSVGDLFCGLDCLVAASEQEGFALAITEAWAAGCPVVATRVGAIPEMERAAGPLVVSVPDNPTPAQLAAAVRKAVRPENREVVERARAAAWQHLSAARMAREWDELLSQRNEPPV